MFVILPRIEAHSAEIPYRSYEALLPNVDNVGRLKSVRELDAQFTSKGIQGAQGSCACTTMREEMRQQWSALEINPFPFGKNQNMLTNAHASSTLHIESQPRAQRHKKKH